MTTPIARWLALASVALVAFANAPANANLIVNADFEGGNAGFSSDHMYSPGNITPPGVYDVLANPSSAHGSATSYGDHTTGSGLMMAVNGSTTPGQVVWGQTVSVTPGATYDFAVWISSWYPAAPAELNFSVNGNVIGSLTAPATAGVWDLGFSTWNSGAMSTALIEVKNANTVFTGNDFALDDFFFGDPIFSNPDPVPAPPVGLLFGLGLAGLGWAARRRRLR
ncbi:MAG: hypothetical protein AB7I36_19465 [Rhodospirillaceae bacterium]